MNIYLIVMTEIHGIEISSDKYDAESSVSEKKVVIVLKPKAVIKPIVKSKLIPKQKPKPIPKIQIDTISELSDMLNESHLDSDDNSVLSIKSTQTTKTTKTTKTTPKSKSPTEPPKIISKENTYSRWIYGEQLLISTEDNTYIYDPKDLSLIGKVLDESNIEWY